jgi:hypothetical protein
MSSTKPASAAAADQVAGNLILFNDNGAWCWYQDPRTMIDRTNGLMMMGSVPAREGIDGEKRAGNIELTSFNLATGERKVFVLHEKLEVDDHDAPALWTRPDGRYLAMYAKHNTDKFSRWRVSVNPHDPTAWTPERTFDWTPLIDPVDNATYSNLHYLSSEKRLYNFVRGINDDPSIMVSMDNGDTWSYGGKLLTIEKLGYVNGYVRYASNGVDRIDFITTEHHPRDFNNSIYHGYVKGTKLQRSDGTVVDENVLDGDGKPQTLLTKIFAADSVVGGEKMTHAWTTDLRLDPQGNPVAIISCRANDDPENSNYNDHRFFYARFDGKDWKVNQLAKAGARLWEAEQDYTGLVSIDPHDVNTVYASTTVDPRDGSSLAHHEIFKGVTGDSGATWKWEPITQNSSVDNLRPIVVPGDDNVHAVLWFRGTMTRSQHYDMAAVGVVEQKSEKVGPIVFAQGSKLPALADGSYDLFVFFKGNPAGDASIRAGLSANGMLHYRQRACQQTEAGQFRGYLGRVKVSGGSSAQPMVDDSTKDSLLGFGYAPVTTQR